MKKQVLLLLFFMAGISKMQGQQDPMYTMYMFNGLVLNPAYAGSREMLSATLIGRQQWMGLAGSPQTASFSIHAPSTNLRNGYGLIVSNDKIGYTRNFSFIPSYAFRIPVGEEGALSLGLQAGLNSYKVNLSEIDTWQPNDYAFSGQNFSKLHFIAGTGIYLNTRKFYAGLSVPNLLPNKLYDPSDLLSVAQKERHFFATAGIVLKVGTFVKIKPSALVKYVPGTPVAMDVNLSFLLDDKVWLGGSWRPGDGFAFLFEVNIRKSFRLGYSYDLMNNDLSSYSGGTHEIMLGFDFGFEKNNMSTPRYF